jgi:hypothetical protein
MEWVRHCEIDAQGYKIPGVIKCDCGAKVELDSGWANECRRCHAEYNGSRPRGDRAAPCPLVPLGR